jgi:hypothetical protein
VRHPMRGIARRAGYDPFQANKHTQPTETWEPIPLSTVCNPTTNLSVSNTSRSPLDLGTFRPNQYIFSCSLCTPSDPRRAYKFTRWCWSQTPTIGITY